MIRRIERIEDFRAFKQWSWPEKFGDLQRVTVLYGANGSGKSTLAELLREGATEVAARAGVELVGAKRGARNDRDADVLWRRLHVFNKAYVHDVLRFDAPHGVTPKALLTVGQLSVEATRRIDDLTDRLHALDGEGEQTGEIEQAEGVVDEATAEAKRVAKRGADQLVQDCTGVSRFDGRAYNSRTFTKVLELPEDQLKAAASTSPESDRRAIASRGLEALSVPRWTPVDWPDLWERAREVIHVDVIAERLPELDAAPEAVRDWVRDGVLLHPENGEKQTCAFCTNPLAHDRLRALNAHFSPAVRSAREAARYLGGSVAGLIKEIEDSRTALLGFGTKIAPELSAEWATEIAALVGRQDAAVTALGVLARALEQRSGDAFTDIEWDAAELEPLDMPRVAALLDRHNDLARDQGSRLIDAAARLESHQALVLQEEFLRYTGAASAAQDLVDELQGERRDLASELAVLRARERESAPLAAELTQALSRLLGRSDIAFSAANSAETDTYEVLRDGQPALYLSEGERTAVALLYFLARIDQVLREPGSLAGPIVVIDDPVSSLDAGIGLGVSSQIWHRLIANENVAQVVVLTHSVELMRALHRRLRKKPHTKNYAVGELRMVAAHGADGGFARVPTLIPMRLGTGDKAHDLFWSTEYEYLFWRVAQVFDVGSQPAGASSPSCLT